MEELILDQMTTALSQVKSQLPVGRIVGVSSNHVRIAGFPATCRIGDQVELRVSQKSVRGEIVSLGQNHCDVLLDGISEGVSIGIPVKLTGAPVLSPHSGWIGRVVDPDGKPLDGKPLLPGRNPASIMGRVLPAGDRRPMGQRLETGIAALNTLLPIVRGQRVGLFAGSGVGKSTLMAQLAQNVTADVIVIALAGERGREVREFTQETLGSEGMKRSVVVAATSDRSPSIRRRCAWSATAIAEYFRDQGLQVLLLCDSVTRFCEAHREVAVASGEKANLRGFPSSTNAAIASLCERAGPGTTGTGDITAIYTVLVAGSDMDEPIADMLRGILDGHIVLDRSIAEKGRFPAVDIVRSVSRSLPSAANEVENGLIQDARKNIATYAASATMIRAGLYEEGSDKGLDAAIACHQALESFLSITDGRPIQAHFASLRQALQQVQPTH